MSLFPNLPSAGIFKSLLNKPGDELSARVTKNGRKVLKVSTDDVKYSVTQYPSGVIHETKTYKPKDD